MDGGSPRFALVCCLSPKSMPPHMVLPYSAAFLGNMFASPRRMALTSRGAGVMELQQAVRIGAGMVGCRAVCDKGCEGAVNPG